MGAGVPLSWLSFLLLLLFLASFLKGALELEALPLEDSVVGEALLLLDLCFFLPFALSQVLVSSASSLAFSKASCSAFCCLTSASFLAHLSLAFSKASKCFSKHSSLAGSSSTRVDHCFLCLTSPSSTGGPRPPHSTTLVPPALVIPGITIPGIIVPGAMSHAFPSFGFASVKQCFSKLWLVQALLFQANCGLKATAHAREAS